MQEVKKPLRVSQADKCSFTELCPPPPPPLAILQTHLATLTNTCNNLDKYMTQQIQGSQISRECQGAFKVFTLEKIIPRFFSRYQI